MSIQAQQRSTYETMWGFEQYAAFAPGERHVDLFLEMVGDVPDLTACSVLDAGCGSGKGALALRARGFQVRMCDLTREGLVPEAARAIPFTEAALWQDLTWRFGFLRGGAFDYVYCCDVLEHVPPEFTMLVLARLLAVTRRALFLTIALAPDNFGAFVGAPLHQTVQSFTWWRDHLAELARVIECRDLANQGVYLVSPT